MDDKPFPGFPWFSYPPPKEDRMYNELYLRIEKLEERVDKLERLVTALLDVIDAKLKLLDNKDDSISITGDWRFRYG